ncbi:hypothetical protein BGX28_002253, partial [Mortierella sp. GBA30]
HEATSEDENARRDYRSPESAAAAYPHLKSQQYHERHQPKHIYEFQQPPTRQRTDCFKVNFNAGLQQQSCGEHSGDFIHQHHV